MEIKVLESQYGFPMLIIINGNRYLVNNTKDSVIKIPKEIDYFDSVFKEKDKIPTMLLPLIIKLSQME